jgi:hypothetical protein
VENLIKYIIRFLLGSGNNTIIDAVGYTADENIFEQYKVVIVPSGFFDKAVYGKKGSLPALPLDFIDGIPLLFGKAIVEKKGKTLVIHADIIASSYFLLSRYEEWICTDVRDSHGRFPGKESIAYKAGVLHRPIVDEYGRFLRKCLREAGISIDEPPAKFKKIYLTHDVDEPFRYRTYRNIAGAFLTSIKEKKNYLSDVFKTFKGNLNDDPLFTFPWILEENDKLKNLSETIFFLKAAKKSYFYDKPVYNLQSKDIRRLIALIKKNGGKIGLHSSYFSGEFPEIIPEEKNRLEKAIGEKVFYNRHHFLRSKEPQDMQYLISAGITDDFTLGYADVAGFRLGTSQSVKWIDVRTKTVTDLNLHPLILMDVSLSEEKYMNLTFDEALEYAKILINKVKEFNGELVLLWHNSVLTDENSFGHKELYRELLKHLKNTSTQKNKTILTF